MSEWIPVNSGRLPKPYTWVYITLKSLIDDRENWVVDTCYAPSKIKIDDGCGSIISDWGNIPMLNMGYAEVVAWMEWIRPEPYNPEKDMLRSTLWLDSMLMTDAIAKIGGTQHV